MPERQKLVNTKLYKLKDTINWMINRKFIIKEILEALNHRFSVFFLPFN